MKCIRVLFLGLAVFVAACGNSETTPNSTQPSVYDPVILVSAAPPVVPEKKEGIIAGEVLFRGIPPVPKRISVNKDKGACGEFQDSDKLVMGGNKGIKWAVVSLKFPAVKTKMKWEGVKLDQRRCRFSPHVLLVPVGNKMTILNPDSVLHNFHTYSVINPSINRAQPKFKKEMDVRFDKPEIFRIGCDAHSWMSGWIVAIEHPFYAVTDEKGSFRLEVVPAGKQVLKVWHETLGELSAEVEVKPNETTKVTLEMGNKVGGKALYEKNCVACHGPKGSGDGPAAAAMPNKPADLTLPVTQKKSDGELSKIVSEGTAKGMPPWKSTLKDEEIKAVVEFIKEFGSKK